MDNREAFNRIADEFISKYYEWLKDHNGTELTEMEYGRKYGYGRRSDGEPYKDNLKTLIHFQSHYFQGRWMPGWEKAGYDRATIRNLINEGLLSYQYYSNWMARNTGCTEWVFIPQRVAKEIYKIYKKHNEEGENNA